VSQAEILFNSIEKLFIGRIISSIAVVIGGVVIYPKELYLVDFTYELFEGVPTEKIVEDYSRKMIRELITETNDHFSNELVPTKLFILAKTKRDELIENFLPKQNLIPKSRRGQSSHRINISHSKSNEIQRVDMTDEIWYQATISLQGFCLKDSKEK